MHLTWHVWLCLSKSVPWGFTALFLEGGLARFQLYFKIKSSVSGCVAACVPLRCIGAAQETTLEGVGACIHSWYVWASPHHLLLWVTVGLILFFIVVPILILVCTILIPVLSIKLLKSPVPEVQYDWHETVLKWESCNCWKTTILARKCAVLKHMHLI